MLQTMTIRQGVEGLGEDGLPLSQHTLRLPVKGGPIPVRFSGNKAMLFYPNGIGCIRWVYGSDNGPATGILRVDV